MIKHCQEKAEEYWALYNSIANRENALQICGKASAYDEMVGFLKNGY